MGSWWYVVLDDGQGEIFVEVESKPDREDEKPDVARKIYKLMEAAHFEEIVMGTAVPIKNPAKLPEPEWRNRIMTTAESLEQLRRCKARLGTDRLQ